MKKITLLFLLIIVSAIIPSSISYAEVPQLISYQGRLLNTSGNPVADGVYGVTFNLYDVSSGGTAFWAETHSTVSTFDGLFHVILGSITSFSSSSGGSGSEIYLGITIGSDPEMTPRAQLLSVPFAFSADRADTAQFSYNSQSTIYSDTAFYAHNASWSDTAGYASGAHWSDSSIYAFSSGWADTSDHAKSIADATVGSASIVDASIALVDIDQNGASDGQIIKWNSSLSSWETVDETVGSGDITAVNAGTGLAGGGTSGDVALGISNNGVTSTHIQDGTISSQDLSNFGAVDGQMLKWNSSLSTWEAVDDAGDISAVTAGSGLTGGGTSGDVTLDIQTGSVTSLHIQDNSITSVDLQNNAVASSKIAPGAVGSSKILANAINSSHIASDAVGSDEIIDRSINTWDINIDAVTDSNLADNSVGYSELQTNAVRSNNILSLSIIESHIRDGAVTTDKIEIHGVTRDKLAYSAVHSDQIANNSITSDDIADASVYSIDLANESGLTNVWFPGTEITTLTTTVTSVHINAPNEGYILVMATFEASINNGLAGTTHLVYVISDSIDSFAGSVSTSYDPGTGDRRSGLSSHKIFEVSGPGSYTYHFNAYKFGSKLTYITRMYLTAIYIPTAYGAVAFPE